MFRILIIVILFLLPFRLLADWQPYSINYTVKDGLPSSECYYVLTDKKGYIWVATDYGISCYNGRKFTNYISELREKSIILMICDKQNKLWFISANGLFGYIKNKKVHYPRAAFLLKEQLKKGSVISLNYNEQGDILIGTTQNLFEARKTEKYKILHKVYSAPAISNASFACLKRIRKNTWIASWNRSPGIENLSHKKRLGMRLIHLFFFEGENFKRELKLDLQKIDVSASNFQFFETSDHQRYLIYLNMLVHFSRKKEQIKEYKNRLHLMVEDREGNLFITTTGNGVYFYKNGRINTTNPDHILAGEVVGSMTQDKSGGYWFTTTQHGLFYIPYFNVCDLSQTQGMLIKRIRFLNNRLYVVEGNESFYSLNKEKNELIKYKSGENNYVQKGAPIDIRFLNGKMLFMGGFAGKVDPRKKQITIVRSKDKMIPLYLSGVAQKERTLLATGGSDLMCIEGNSAMYLRTLPTLSTNLFYSKKTNRIIIGTRSGLYTYNNEKNRIRPFEPEIFRDKYITMVKELSNGYLLVATKNNGFFFQSNEGWKHVTEEDGLLSTLCKEFYVLNDKLVILLMQGGVNYFHLDAPDKIYHLRFLEGLFTDEIKCLELHKDELYVGYGNGVLRFPVSMLRSDLDKEAIYLSGYEYNGKVTTKKTFSYGGGIWRFYVDLLNYKKNGKGISYVYHLKGYDQQPRDGSSEYLEYTNLPAGKYELLVSVKDQNGTISPYKKLITFTVQTPFWQTWWFIILSFLFAVGLMTSIIVWRIRILNSREAKRNDLLRQIAESQVIALRAQMNPHFIFNAINSIQDFVLQNETEDAYSYLSKFARLIRLVMHQSNNNFLTLEQEIDWLKIYMELEQLRFRGKFEFELIVDPELELDFQIPNMLIQPHLENAIWHGIMPLKGSRQGKIRLAFLKDGDKLRVEIEDNGVGRGNAPEKKEHESSGIKLVTDRLERLSQLENIQFKQEIIDVVDEQHEAKGTLVLLFIDQLD